MTRQTPLVRGRWLYLCSIQLDLILMPLHSTLALSKASPSTQHLFSAKPPLTFPVLTCCPNTKLLNVSLTQVTYCSSNTRLLTVPPKPSYCSPNTKLLTVPPTPSYLLLPQHQVIFLQFPQHQVTVPPHQVT